MYSIFLLQRNILLYCTQSIYNILHANETLTIDQIFISKYSRAIVFYPSLAIMCKVYHCNISRGRRWVTEGHNKAQCYRVHSKWYWAFIYNWMVQYSRPTYNVTKCTQKELFSTIQVLYFVHIPWPQQHEQLQGSLLYLWDLPAEPHSLHPVHPPYSVEQVKVQYRWRKETVTPHKQIIPMLFMSTVWSSGLLKEYNVKERQGVINENISWPIYDKESTNTTPAYLDNTLDSLSWHRINNLSCYWIFIYILCQLGQYSWSNFNRLQGIIVAVGLNDV